MLHETVGVLAVSPLGRAARRLHVGGPPVSRPENSQERLRTPPYGTHFKVVGERQDTSPFRPIFAQVKDEVLKIHPLARTDFLFRYVFASHMDLNLSFNFAGQPKWRFPIIFNRHIKYVPKKCAVPANPSQQPPPHPSLPRRGA